MFKPRLHHFLKESAFGRQTRYSMQGAVKSQAVLASLRSASRCWTCQASTSRCENARKRPSLWKLVVFNSQRQHTVDRRNHDFPSTSGHSTNCWVLPSAPHQKHRFSRVVSGVQVDLRLIKKEFELIASFRDISGIEPNHVT